MEWPKDLIELFDDPLLADVRPKVTALTFSDRKDKQVAELEAWIAAHGREPQRRPDGETHVGKAHGLAKTILKSWRYGHRKRA